MEKKLKTLTIAGLAFPLPVAIIIPALLLYFTKGFEPGWGTEGISLWLSVLAGIVLIVTGVILAWRTVFLFYYPGDGTPAPWAPPKNFVVLGPYRYVRNPMVVGVLSVLLGESVLFGSLVIFDWLLIFWFGMNLFIIFYEEPGLEKRFGEDYRRYRQNVRRWLPRPTPYKP
jgi:protein-S-isoprenylcysteine O-methyltransferase Ste14